ncbi:MAG: single-stranded DNA-binding protein [bacterium]
MLELNKVFLIGNLTRDPEIRYLPSGMAVSKFDIAVNRRFKDKTGESREETMFIRVESWGKQAEFVNEYLKKGRRVFVEGRLKQETWEAKDGSGKRSAILVSAERIQFADPPRGAAVAQEEAATGEGGEQEVGTGGGGSSAGGSSSEGASEGGAVDDDLPF